MIAMSKLVLESRDYDFWTNLRKTKFRSLQSYLKKIAIIYRLYNIVQFGFEITLILGPQWTPHFDHHCNHSWSPL